MFLQFYCPITFELGGYGIFIPHKAELTSMHEKIISQQYGLEFSLGNIQMLTLVLMDASCPLNLNIPEYKHRAVLELKQINPFISQL